MSATYDQLQQALGAALAEVDTLRRENGRLRWIIKSASEWLDVSKDAKAASNVLAALDATEPKKDSQ